MSHTPHGRTFPLSPLLRLLSMGPLYLLVASAQAAIPSTDSWTDAPTPPRITVRPVRVLLATSTERLRVGAAGGLTIHDASGNEIVEHDEDDSLIITRNGGHLWLSGAAVDTPWLTLESSSASPLTLAFPEQRSWAAPTSYDGTLRVSPDERSGIRVINEVGIEPYVAGVVAGEAWPTFHVETLRAQAIVARTFVLDQMLRRDAAPWDIVATQGGQVYRGIRTDQLGRRSREAAEYTRGIVCTWRAAGGERIFPTYYSAACGGGSQSAAIFGEGDHIPPLAGGVRCDYCRIAPGGAYRWEPVTIPLEDVSARLAARYPALQEIGRLSDVQVIERNGDGRPVRVRLSGSGEASYDLLAESFRLALGGGLVRSTDCKIQVKGDLLEFSEGKGFGHGLGLCQWGAEGQALEGRRAGEIIRFYYPGVTLRRAY